MSVIYNSLLSGAKGLVTLAAACLSDNARSKTCRFLRGQKRVFKSLRSFAPADENFWFHCASLGEYAIARPLMEDLRRRRPDARIVLTFFSPTGIEALKSRKNVPADLVCYLPLDSRSNARAFLDVVKPKAAMFMVSEYWPNYLLELHRRNIPAYLISAVFTHRAPHFRRVGGGAFRESLKAYDHIFCLNRQGVDTLAELGFTRASVEADPLVDNALSVAETPWLFAPLEEFCARTRTLIAGSISDENDVNLLAHEINSNVGGRQYLLVPHEVDEYHISQIESALKVPSRRLSAYSSDMTENVMIVDNIGMLAYLYRLGTMAYIGGGFTRELHSVLEATVYGLPISFGPRTERKAVAQQLVEMGLATITPTPEAFSAWADAYFNASATHLHRLRVVGTQYCHEQAGATSRILTKILSSCSH